MNEVNDVRETDSLELAIKRILNSFWHTIINFWMIIPLTALLLGTIGGLISYIRYTPKYTSQATYTVQLTSDSITYYNTTTAKQLANSFPYILSSGELMSLVAKDLGLPGVPASIYAKVLSSTNMLTLYVTSSDPDMSYNVLQSVVKLYPQIAEYVVGKTELHMVISPSVPDSPDNAFAWAKTAAKFAVFGAAGVLLVFFVISIFKITVICADDLRDRFGGRSVVSVPLILLESRKKKLKKPGIFAKKKAAKNTEKKSESERRAEVPPSERLISINDSSVNKSFKDAFSKLRNAVTHSDGSSKIKTVIVTSTLPGEGKTTVSINLALALSKHHHNVLLVDCDLRKPSVFYLLGLDCKVPFSDVIRGKAKLTDAVINYNDSLTIVGDTHYNSDASELVSSDFMRKLIQKGPKVYDYIIIDSPPCNDISDSVALAEWADGLIYVVRQDYALFSSITASIGKHHEGHAKLVSFVLNGVKRSSTADQSAGSSISGS